MFKIQFHSAALHIAVDKGSAEIVQLLLDRSDLDINLLSVFTISFLNKVLNSFNLYSS